MGLDRERVHLATHHITERRVDELVPLERALAGELGGDHQRLEMGVVVGQHPNLATGQSGGNGALNFGGFHRGRPDVWRGLRRAAV